MYKSISYMYRRFFSLTLFIYLFITEILKSALWSLINRSFEL